jgi:hypothetical protein
MAETMSGVPMGKNTVQSIMTVVASSPHISMIVDHAVTLKPGAELFSIAIGPREKVSMPHIIGFLKGADFRHRDGHLLERKT